MNNQPFTHVDDAVLTDAIRSARQRLVFIAPGLHPPVALALAEAMKRLPAEAVHVVLDVDAEVCRLGYGDAEFKGMEIVQAAAEACGLTINHHPGIRIGLLIADEATLVYSPVPRLIEAGSHQPDKPNGILLGQQVPTALADACGIGLEGAASLAIGQDPIRPSDITAVKQDLAESPPKEFSLARIERVFNSMLHYVEWEIRDYQLTSRSVVLRPELFGVRHADVVRRLSNRYHLFAKTDSLNVEIPVVDDDGKPSSVGKKQSFGPRSIDEERRRIKKRFIIEAGDFGLLILRKDVAEFEKQLKKLEEQIKAYQEAVKDVLKKRCDDIVTELLAALGDTLKTSPPEHWRSRFLGKDPTDNDVKRLFEDDIRGEVERVNADFKPRMFHAYKDVTYQTFRDKAFLELLEKRFGKDAMTRIFSEHDAAPEAAR